MIRCFAKVNYIGSKIYIFIHFNKDALAIIHLLHFFIDLKTVLIYFMKHDPEV